MSSPTTDQLTKLVSAQKFHLGSHPLRITLGPTDQLHVPKLLDFCFRESLRGWFEWKSEDTSRMGPIL